MARKHGWQLPAHTLQVGRWQKCFTEHLFNASKNTRSVASFDEMAEKYNLFSSSASRELHLWLVHSIYLSKIVAITVFFLLVVAFYAFFAPFLGTQVLEYIVIGVYTPVALAVFILYIRCTSINPADPGIMSKFEDGFINVPANSAGIEGTNLPQKANNATGTNSPTSTCRSSLDGHSNQRGSSIGETNINLGSQQPKKRSSCWLLGGLLCAIFIKEDCRKPDDSEQQANGEEALFCTLCNAEWLNNCVGRKNYFTFLALMAISLIWLAIEFAAGIAVIVLCFVDKNASRNIQDKLGNGLTPPPFAVIVGIFTLLSLVACIPLGELFFFHIILIRKGITTYDYVVAMRAMSEAAPEDEEGANIIYSPSNSATTGFSVGSSLGLHHKGAWCTPPRIFIDHDEVIPHLDPGMVPSTVDPDAAGYADRANKAKKAVKISARSLAKLDKNEVMKAAAKARASSSVLRPIDTRRGHEADAVSSGNASIRSSSATSYVRENRRASVVWDQEAGRYVSVPAQTRMGPGVEQAARNPRFLANPSGEPSSHGRSLAPGNTSSSAMPSGQPLERLTYSGQSIFFGGPILSTPGINAQRNEAAARARPEGSRDPNAQQRDIRGEKARTGSLPVFAPGAFQKNPPFDK
ncbi:putative protein S-acyltransferase 19 [Panicum miliaceum]|uniref:S-acyltransferase n=1 Tax=Panicum miliaceum TaxID=4540 RepID=A0A3L6QW49_PANMI|nr:putative protein S-acyltransferase 19 [Panicum miliaceum]